MISAQIIKNSISQLQAVTKVDLTVTDLSGSVVATTTDEPIADAGLISGFAMSPADSQVVGNRHLLKIMDEGEPSFILIASGEGETAYMTGRICCFQIQDLIVAYKERYDRNNFFQNLMLDNMLLIDVYNRAKKLHIDVSVPRVVLLVDVSEQEGDNNAQEVLGGMFSAQSGDYITAVDESSIIIIKSLGDTEDYTEIEKISDSIVDMMSTELMMNVHVAYGTIVGELKDLSKSYKEAKMALEVGKIFYVEKKVNAYNTLGIGRLIYQLPINLCHIFMKEIFGDRDVISQLDEETLSTIARFFENNLNVSETSRQLFVHRNTLVYRIEKLERLTGLDIRKFDDAMTFKIALMVSNYMRYLDTHEY
ncbi:PucR family transcriptional regulator [Butyrivibrio sp. MC2013]|uniref:PucR family transcriptional regulator n=1 Tax=Butyrivibrio sp. MC2013 TaxID=1280686 RepID=UPI000405D6D4|nr:helix-turn-helix domain-containing protein [Butyrivibrio sp. MC2013]